MPEYSENSQQTPRRASRKRLELPLEAHREPASEWVYEHRVPIFVSVIVYLSLAILFISGKIVMSNASPRSELMYFDAEQFEVLQAELEKAEEENRRLTAMQAGSYGRVQNLSSNENAAAGDGHGSSQINNQGYLKDDRGTDMQSIYEYAEQVEEQLREGSEAYEEGLARQQALMNSRNRGSGSSGGANATSSGSGSGSSESSRVVEGNVTVSYSFSKPLRSHVNLVVPAYQCRGGGQVAVNVSIDRNGNVVGATVDSSRSTDDYCMTNAATNAAFNSRFNVDETAPAKQTGTIIYTFVPQ